MSEPEGAEREAAGAAPGAGARAAAGPGIRSGAADAPRRTAVASVLIGTGIFASRVVGLVRERLIATYFGASLYADVFAAALRLPNVLQNLLGEGTLSASFIPVYSELLGQGRRQEAGRVAGAVFALLLAVAGLVCLLGVLLAPLLVSVFTPGFDGERRELMIAMVRIVFPMTGVLVLSAWALGILNSHRRFFVPYFAPVLWNAAIIGTLVAFGGRFELDGLLLAVGWGALLGGLLQFLVQLPFVIAVDREIRIGTGRREPAFHEVVRNAGPAILGRGVVQLSGYIDLVLVTLLAVGAAARLRYAQTLYILPVSLFAMSIAAAELPELARERGLAIEQLRSRAVAALERVAFFIVPSCVAFIVLGDVFVAGLYEAGEFTAADVGVVYLVLAAYSLGMPASTTTRIYQSAFFALRDTRTPARTAALRVLVSAVLGALLMVQFEPVQFAGLSTEAGLFGGAAIDGVPLGPVGLALGAACGAWLEWFWLRRRLGAALGPIAAGRSGVLRMLAAAAVGGVAGYGTKLGLGGLHPLAAAFVVAAVFGGVYLGVGAALGLAQARALPRALLSRVLRRG